MNARLIERILDCLVLTPYIYDLEWNREGDDLSFSINCNDVFCMAADAVRITEDNIDILEQAIKEMPKENGHILFCARADKIRPMNNFYKHIPKEQWPIFDACGEERDENNPYNGGKRPE